MILRWIEPLDLKTLLVNTFSGSMEIFTFISIIVIAGLAAYFRMKNEVALLMILLFGIIMSVFIGQGYLVFLILIIGLVVYYLIGRIVK